MSAPMNLEKVFVREVQRNDSEILQINQCEVGDVGCVVWDAAIVLAKYLESHDFHRGNDLVDKAVVEIGAGTGVVGLMAASYGAMVTITDLEEFVPLMQLNIDTNKHLCRHPVQAKELKWGSELKREFSHVDIVLVADCIYYEESLEPLLKTLDDLCGNDTCIYCCYEERTTDNKPELQRKFLHMVEKIFSVKKIPEQLVGWRTGSPF
ncbi:protein N-lysine methyltransferase METTL21D-like isoform X2 [Mercenaria mercenaria]|uniref:protein N-lysine methyltransferase METTL21D-like isoform X2 n=1 Tax=Mercenaria mercenaria TaxID=6596 RepID=UPI00234F4A36|nr:protein N-lysine methyltransferase METTL21D-like isoform X2 [Mercenaria mercenaria]